MGGDNDLYLSMTKVVRSWSIGPGQHARKIAIAQSIVTPLLCPGRETIYIAFDWLVAWISMMGLKNVVIVLCWWAYVVILLSFNNFSMCLLSSSKKCPKHRWSSYSITSYSWPKSCLKRQWYLPLISYKTLPWQTWCSSDSNPSWHNWQILSSSGICAYLPNSISNWCGISLLFHKKHYSDKVFLNEVSKCPITLQST